MSPTAAALRAPVSPGALEDPAQVAAAYERWVERVGLADRTKSAYAGQVRRYADWLAGSPKHDSEPAFTDTDRRDYASQDYRRYLLTVRKLSPKSVDQAMTALGSLYGWLGVGPPSVPRGGGRVGDETPRALTEDQTRDVLRAARRRGVRDHALVATGLFTGLRASELAALDHDDVWVTDRKGEVMVRAGKGDQPRKVPLNTQGRDALRPWLATRPTWLHEPTEPALWVARAGGERIGVRSVSKAIAATGTDAGVHLSPHVLRHTFAVMHVQVRGTPLTTVADFLGHRDLNTTRNYERTTAEHRDQSAERFVIDY